MQKNAETKLEILNRKNKLHTIWIRASKARAPPRGGQPACFSWKNFYKFLLWYFKNWSIFHFQILQFKCYQNTPNLDAFNLVKTCFLTFVLSWERLSFTFQTIPIWWSHIFQLYSTFKNATFLYYFPTHQMHPRKLT